MLCVLSTLLVMKVHCLIWLHQNPISIFRFVILSLMSWNFLSWVWFCRDSTGLLIIGANFSLSWEFLLLINLTFLMSHLSPCSLGILIMFLLFLLYPLHNSFSGMLFMLFFFFWQTIFHLVLLPSAFSCWLTSIILVLSDFIEFFKYQLSILFLSLLIAICFHIKSYFLLRCWSLVLLFLWKSS